MPAQYFKQIPENSKTYNNIEIGYLNKLGINNNYINYFNVISVMINNVEREIVRTTMIQFNGNKNQYIL